MAGQVMGPGVETTIIILLKVGIVLNWLLIMTYCYTLIWDVVDDLQMAKVNGVRESAPNGTEILHFLLPQFADHWGGEGEKRGIPETVMTTRKQWLVDTQQGNLTCDSAAITTAHTNPKITAYVS